MSGMERYITRVEFILSNPTNESGCTDIATLNLTINNSSSSSEDVTACELYEWNGELYFESGVYTFNTDNSFGCDSVATIYLTINYPNNSNDTVIACDSYEWNGEVYNESGTYEYSEQNNNEFSMSFNGVDDVVELTTQIVYP